MAGEPKIDLDALTARLQGALNRSMAAADAQGSVEPVALVSSATEKKSGQRFHGAREENGRDADRERVRARWIKETGDAIAEAKNLDQLIKMVASIEGKRGKKLDFPLPEDLLILLKSDKEFSREFNALSSAWSNRVVEILFNEDGVSRFRESLRSRRETSRGEFFNEYLGRDFRDLKMVPAVIVKMKNLWDKYYPDLKQENLSKRLFKRLVDTWRKHATPFEFVNEKNGRKLIVTSIGGDHAGDCIEYDYRKDNESEFIKCHITSSEIIGFLKGFRENFGIELISEKSISLTKNPGSVDRGGDRPVSVAPGSARRPDGEPKTPVKPLSKQKGKGSSKFKRQSPPPLDMDDAVFGARNADAGDLEDDEKASAIRGLQRNKAVAVATPTPQEAIAKSLERTYDELFKEADAKVYHSILFGAAAAGISTMQEGAEKESVDLKIYDKDHPGEILGALIDGMKDSLARVGKKLGWSESETDIYARGLVQKSIEKYLK